jgi:hypothetical protein
MWIDPPIRSRPACSATVGCTSDSNTESNNESVSAPRTSSDDNVVPPAMTLTFSERVRLYEKPFTRPESLIGPILGAGIGQARNSPEEWEAERKDSGFVWRRDLGEA